MDRLTTICLIAMTIFFIALGSATTNVEGLRARVAALEERVEALEKERALLNVTIENHARAVEANTKYIEARQAGHGTANAYARRAGYQAEDDH